MRPAGWLAACALPLLATGAVRATGYQVCAECHGDVVARFRTTPMAKALEPVSRAEILRRRQSLTFQDSGFQWRIVREGDRSVMTVTGQGETLTVPLLWAFGRGQAGQTYVFERDGTLWESHVSFYNALDGLDLTMGARPGKPSDIGDAAGRRMDAIGARECFGCHSTGAASGGALNLESIAPGVGCESCHGPAEQHVAAVRAGNPVAAKMPSLAGRGAEQMAELCGRCHRTWSQIALKGPRGVLNVRFQPYRLTNSRCYDTNDARILTCAANLAASARGSPAATPPSIKASAKAATNAGPLPESPVTASSRRSSTGTATPAQARSRPAKSRCSADAHALAA